MSFPASLEMPGDPQARLKDLVRRMALSCTLRSGGASGTAPPGSAFALHSWEKCPGVITETEGGKGFFQWRDAQSSTSADLKQGADPNACKPQGGCATEAAACFPSWGPGVAHLGPAPASRLQALNPSFLPVPCLQGVGPWVWGHAGGRGWGETRVWIVASSQSGMASCPTGGEPQRGRRCVRWGLNSLSLLEAGLW